MRRRTLLQGLIAVAATRCLPRRREPKQLPPEGGFVLVGSDKICVRLGDWVDDAMYNTITVASVGIAGVGRAFAGLRLRARR